MKMMMNASGSVSPDHCERNNSASCVEFALACTRSDSVLPQSVTSAAMTMTLTQRLFTVQRGGISLTHPVGSQLQTQYEDLLWESWTDYNRHLTTCIACGQRDNSSQHWTRFCIIPVLVANALSSSDHTIRSLDQLARTNTAGCVVASHILHQF